MDFKLTEEEKLIQSTAVQFVKKELLTREGDYLRQREHFLPPGDPPRRRLDADIHQTLTSIAQRLGLWTLELPESGAEPIGYLAPGSGLPRVRPKHPAVRAGLRSGAVG